MISVPIYLDYNATAPVSSTVREAIGQALDRFGNPSSPHRPGRAARALVEDAREAVATAVNASPAGVVFTSGGTEANALALRGVARAAGCVTVLANAVEHASVLAHVAPADLIGVDGQGRLDVKALDEALAGRPAPALIAVMAANNETGVIQPIGDVIAIARRHGALVHCDAVQALGKMPLDFTALGVDSMAISAHKIGGLKGTGALILRPGFEPAAEAIGGGQERRRRAGTENTIGIAAFGAAAAQCGALREAMPRVAALRDRLETELSAVSGVEIFGAGTERLGNTLCLARHDITAERQLIALDLAGIAVSAGAACSSGKVAVSHVLQAMGVPADLARCAIRISLGWETTAAEIERISSVWTTLASAAAA